jgi:hypothetical protein
MLLSRAPARNSGAQSSGALSAGDAVIDGTGAQAAPPGINQASGALEAGYAEIAGDATLQAVIRTAMRGGGGWLRRNYIYKGKRYWNLTPDELARLIALDAIDITREDIKVVYSAKKPHKIAKTTFEDIKASIARLNLLIPVPDVPKVQNVPKIADTADDDDIEELLALL